MDLQNNRGQVLLLNHLTPESHKLLKRSTRLENGRDLYWEGVKLVNRTQHYWGKSSREWRCSSISIIRRKHEWNSRPLKVVSPKKNLWSFSQFPDMNQFSDPELVDLSHYVLKWFLQFFPQRAYGYLLRWLQTTWRQTPRYLRTVGYRVITDIYT